METTAIGLRGTGPLGHSPQVPPWPGYVPFSLSVLALERQEMTWLSQLKGSGAWLVNCPSQGSGGVHNMTIVNGWFWGILGDLDAGDAPLASVDSSFRSLLFLLLCTSSTHRPVTVISLDVPCSRTRHHLSWATWHWSVSPPNPPLIVPWSLSWLSVSACSGPAPSHQAPSPLLFPRTAIGPKEVEAFSLLLVFSSSPNIHAR